MDSTKNTTPGRPDSDADVGLLLYKTGHAVKQFFLWLGKHLTRLGRAIVVGLLFLLRNIIWLAAGALVGLGVGYYQYTKRGNYYVAQMTVKANFNSTRSLYNTIEYLNALIAAGKTADLANIFAITPVEAKQLVDFSANFVQSELITAEMYQDQFMQYDRTIKVRQDTFWLRTIKYNEFKESLTKFDYPYHDINVRSTNSSIFRKLEKGIVNLVSNNDLLQEVKNRQAISNKDEEKLITQAIQNIDTLRRAYNQRLIKGGSTDASPGNQLTLLENAPEIKTPELELYDKMLELHDQLKKSRKKNSTEKDIIEIYSSFNPEGRRLTFWQQNGMKDMLTGLAAAFAILLLIAAYKSLLTFERTKKQGNVFRT